MPPSCKIISPPSASIVKSPATSIVMFPALTILSPEPTVNCPIISKSPLLFKVAVRVKVPASVLVVPYPKLNIPPVPLLFESPTKFM